MSDTTGMSLRDKMFSFDGRLRRADYWGISIFLGLIVFVITETVMLYGFGPEYSLFTGGFDAGARRAADGWPYAVQMLLNLVTIWPNFAMSAKRAHDRDKSAKVIIALLAIMWILTTIQVPLMSVYAETFTSPALSIAYLAYSFGMLGICIYVFVVVGCLDGTKGLNRFGPSPKADELAEAA